IRIVTFEACPGFTHVTARRIAQLPKATFVTRLQPLRLPARAARQLPDQSTTLRVESSSTGNPRLRGALPISDIGPNIRPARPRPGFRGTGVTEYWIETAVSFRLDVGGPDHLAPFVGFVGDELSKVGRRADKRCASEVSQPRLDFGIGEARVDLSIELVDDLGRRGLRCADAKPRNCLIARHELAEGWEVRQHLRTRRGGYGERAQPASPDILNR